MTTVDPDTAQVVRDITAYPEVLHLAYRPDGRRRAAAACFGNRVGELEPPGSPVEFTNNATGDRAFIEDLNGHPLADSCTAGAHPREAPSSRPRGPTACST